MSEDAFLAVCFTASHGSPEMSVEFSFTHGGISSFHMRDIGRRIGLEKYLASGTM